MKRASDLEVRSPGPVYGHSLDFSVRTFPLQVVGDLPCHNRQRLLLWKTHLVRRIAAEFAWQAFPIASHHNARKEEFRPL
jgi:hypothetical protein